MAVFTGTLNADANGNQIAIDKLLDVIVSSAVSAGWTALARRPNIPAGELSGFSGRVTYSTPHRYWRLVLTGTSRVRAREIVLRDHAGTPISLTGCRITATSETGANVIARAFDGNAGTFWQSSAVPASITFDFTSLGLVLNRFESVGSILFTTDASEHIATLRVEFSDDNSTWYSVYDQRLAPEGGDPATHWSGLTWTSGETKTFTLDYVGNSKATMFMRRFGERVYLRGPGGGASRESYAMISSERNLTSVTQGLVIKSAIGYDAARDFSGQTGAIPTDQFVPVERDQIQYWIYINDRRIICQLRCGTIYTGFYLGFFVPFCLPAEYDFPIAVIGSRRVLAAITDANAAHRNFFDPGFGCGAYRKWNGSYVSLGQHDESASVNDPVSGVVARIWPWSVGAASNASFTGVVWDGSAGGNSSGHWLEAVEKTAQGELPILPAMIFDQNGPGLIGSLDGVFCIPGADLTPAQVVTVGARNFRAFPNMSRRAANHWCLIEEL